MQNCKFKLKNFTICFVIGVCIPQVIPNIVQLSVLSLSGIFLLVYLISYSLLISNSKQLNSVFPYFYVNFFSLWLGLAWMLVNIYFFKLNSELRDQSENKHILVLAKILEVNYSNTITNLSKKNDINHIILQLELKINTVFYDFPEMQKLKFANFLKNSKVRVNWYNPKYTIIPGDIWQLHLKLKKPRNFATTGSFDLEKHLFSKRIKMLGTVLTKRNNRLIKHDNNFFYKIKHQLIEYIDFLANDWHLKKKVYYLHCC